MDRCSISYKMLCAGNNVFLSKISLEASNKTGCIFRYDFRIFTIAFIGAPPMVVAYNSQGWSKCPLHTSHCNFPSSCFCDSLHEIGISCSSKPYIMRKYHCTSHIGVPMDGIYTINDWNGQMIFICFHGGSPIFIIHGDPILRSIISRYGTSATEN